MGRERAKRWFRPACEISFYPPVVSETLGVEIRSTFSLPLVKYMYRSRTLDFTVHALGCICQSMHLR